MSCYFVYIHKVLSPLFNSYALSLTKKPYLILLMALPKKRIQFPLIYTLYSLGYQTFYSLLNILHIFYSI